MKQSAKGLLLFIIIILFAFMIGSYILTAVFFGTLTLIGLIVVIESMPLAKRILARSSRVLDVIILCFTIFAIASFGLNIAAALTVAGVGYSLFYAPYLRENVKPRKGRTRTANNYKSKFNAK